MTRDWSRERWRRQYVREPLQQRLWSIMARGLRELLNALAEEDGALVRGATDPADALVRALGPHDDERALVLAAVKTLLDDGFLVIGDGAVWIADFAAAQAASAPRAEAPASAPTHASPPAPATKTSTERVRQFRERARLRAEGVPVNGDGVPAGVSSTVSETVSPVSETVSPSRGDLKSDPLQTLNSRASAFHGTPGAFQAKRFDEAPERRRTMKRSFLGIWSRHSPCRSPRGQRSSSSGRNSQERFTPSGGRRWSPLRRRLPRRRGCSSPGWDGTRATKACAPW